PKGPVGDWYSRCMAGADGRTLSNLANTLLALRSDRAFQGLLAFNQFSDAALLNRRVPNEQGDDAGSYPRPVTDSDITAIREWLQLAGIASVSIETTISAVDLVARENGFHPVREYLESLEWDGTERLDDWMADCLGVEKTEYSMAVSRMFPISMVARIFEP